MTSRDYMDAAARKTLRGLAPQAAKVCTKPLGITEKSTVTRRRDHAHKPNRLLKMIIDSFSGWARSGSSALALKFILHAHIFGYYPFVAPGFVFRRARRFQRLR